MNRYTDTTSKDVDSISTISGEYEKDFSVFASNSSQNLNKYVESQVVPTSHAELSLTRLREFRDWSDNWDAEGAVAPRPEMLDAAEKLLGQVIGCTNLGVKVALASSGSPLLFLWAGDTLGELQILEDGGVLASAMTDDEEFFEEFSTSLDSIRSACAKISMIK